MNFTEKVKVGDTIQSFDVSCPVDTSRGSLIGKVHLIESTTGIEVVHFKAEFKVRNGVKEKLPVGDNFFKVTQNGTETNFGNVTDGIKLLTRKNNDD